jgi:hypothetical protein
MGEWISVEDQEPPNGELVLGLDMADESLATSFRVVWRVTDLWYSGYCRGDVDPITHWMPLPEPPIRS